MMCKEWRVAVLADRLAGGEVGFEGLGDGLRGVEASELQRTVDTHQDRLGGGGAAIGAVGLTVLPQNHRRAKLPLREAVLERHIIISPGT